MIRTIFTAIMLCASSASAADFNFLEGGNVACQYEIKHSSSKNTTTYTSRRCIDGSRAVGAFSNEPLLANRRLFVRKRHSTMFMRVVMDHVEEFRITVPGCRISLRQPRVAKVRGECDGMVIKYGDKPLAIGVGGHVMLFDPFGGLMLGVLNGETKEWRERDEIEQFQDTEHFWGEAVLDLMVFPEIDYGLVGNELVTVTHSILAMMGNPVVDVLSIEDGRINAVVREPFESANAASAHLYAEYGDVLSAGTGMNTVAMCRRHMRAAGLTPGRKRVLIDCLANDITMRDESEDPMTVLGLIDLAIEAKRKAPNADVVVTEEFPRWDGEALQARTSLANAQLAEILSKLPEIARTVDLYSLAGLTQTDYSDNVHLSLAGIEKVAVAVTEEVYQ